MVTLMYFQCFAQGCAQGYGQGYGQGYDQGYAILCIIQVDYTVSRTTALGTKNGGIIFKDRAQGSRIFSRKYLFETLEWAMGGG